MGLPGLLASVPLGVADYLLHVDALSRFSENGCELMKDIPAKQSIKPDREDLFSKGSQNASAARDVEKNKVAW